jgi:hypothetical protein
MENKSHSISDVAIGDFHQKDYQSVIEYKAFAFLADQTKTTFNYEVKRVRAVWDPGLSIPGTERRGGWRCPPGVRFGGQITDRFGRNCGWGIARRIANALTNVGEMVEGRDDDRRARRVAKRNARMVRRLARDEEGGLLERGARGIADVLDGGEVSAPTPDADAPEVGVPSAPRVDRPTLEELPETEDKKSGFFRSLFNGFVKDFNDRKAKRREETDAAIERAMGLSPKEQWKEIFDAVKRHWGIGKPEIIPEKSGSGRTDEDYARFFEKLNDNELAQLWMSFDGESAGVVLNPEAKEKIRAELERRGMPTDIDELIDAYGTDRITLTGEMMEEAINLFVDDLDMDEVAIDIIDPFTPSAPRPAPRPEPRPRVPSGGRSPRPRPTPDFDPADFLAPSKDRKPKYSPPKRPDGVSDAEWNRYLKYHREAARDAVWVPGGYGGGGGYWTGPVGFDSWRLGFGRSIPDASPDGERLPEVPAYDPRPRPAPDRRPGGLIDFPGFEPEPRRPANNRRPGKFPQELPDLSDEQIGDFIDTITNKLKKAFFPSPLDDIKREMGKRFGTSDISMLTSEQLDELAAWVKQKGKDIKNGKYPRDWENSQGQTFTRFASSILDVRDARNELISRGATPDENGRVHKPNWDRVNENWRERRDREREEREEAFGLGRDREPGVYRSGGGNLRPSEARRMARELREPGAPRTGETPRARTRGASDAGAARTATRRTSATAQGEANIPSKPVTPTRRTVKPKKIKEPNKLSDQEILAEIANPDTDNTTVTALTSEFNARNGRVSLKPNMTSGKVELPADRNFGISELREMIGDDEELLNYLRNNLPDSPQFSMDLRRAVDNWEKQNLDEMNEFIDRTEKRMVEDIEKLEAKIKEYNEETRPAWKKMFLQNIIALNKNYSDRRKQLQKFRARKAELLAGEKIPSLAPSGPKEARDIQRLNAVDLGLEMGDRELEMAVDSAIARGSAFDREMETIAQFKGEEGLLELAQELEANNDKLRPLLDRLNDRVAKGEGEDILEFDMMEFNGFEGEQTIREYRDNLVVLMKNNSQLAKRAEDQVRVNQIRQIAGNEGKSQPVVPVTDGGVIEPELRPAQVDRVLAPRENPEDPNSPFLYNEDNIQEAFEFVHVNGGSLDEIPDNIFFEVLLDGELRDSNGQRVPFDEMLKEGFYENSENRRFTFVPIKDNSQFGMGGLWQVVKVTDKTNGKEYYMKISHYPRNEGVLEMVGMKAAEIVEFPNHANRLRVGQIIQEKPNGRVARWVMTEATQDWDIGVGNSMNGKPADALGVQVIDIEERDAARMAVLDLVLHNEDRHGENFQIVLDERNRQRIIPLDHGILGGGRIKTLNGIDEEITEQDLEQWADETILRFERNGMYWFHDQYANKGVYNNGLANLKEKYRNDTNFPEQRARFLQTVRNSVDKLERELDTLFGVERFEANGLVLTDVEKAHLKQLRRVAEHRIAYLKANPEALVSFFDTDYPPSGMQLPNLI